MAEARIIGNVLVVKSNFQLEELKKLSKFKPEALIKTEKNGEGVSKEVFRISTGPNPSFSRFGVVFNSSDQEGKAIATLPLDVDHDKRLEAVKDLYGYGLLNLNQMENALAAASDTLATEIRDIEENITVE